MHLKVTNDDKTFIISNYFSGIERNFSIHFRDDIKSICLTGKDIGKSVIALPDDNQWYLCIFNDKERFFKLLKNGNYLKFRIKPRQVLLDYFFIEDLRDGFFFDENIEIS